MNTARARLRHVLLAFGLLLVTIPVHAQPEYVEFAGLPENGRDVRLWGALQKPLTPGPHPLVVILSGCFGLQQLSDGIWARRFYEWGYAVLRVDSYFDPHRKVSDRCFEVAGDARARDAHAAWQWAQTRADLHPNRIALFGISHGGWGALLAADERNFKGPRFAGISVVYPWCPLRMGILNTPVQILAAGEDHLAPAWRCAEMRIQNEAPGVVSYEVLPGATHGFDVEGIQNVFPEAGVRYDQDLTRATAEKVHAFLRRRLEFAGP